MIITKRIIKDYLKCDERTAHNYMNMIRAKVPTWTKSVMTECAAKGNKGDALVSLTFANAEDVLKVAMQLLANTTNTRINRDAWNNIQQVCWHEINKGLV